MVFAGFFAALSVCLPTRARRSGAFPHINRTLPGGRKRPVLSLLKLRQAALNDAVDEANDLLAAVFFVAIHNHVHQPVGQVGIEHFQLRLRDVTQVLFPVGDAFAPGKDNRLVLLYENQDEMAAGKIVETLSAQSVVRSVVSYAGTLGRPCTVDEMESALSAMGEGMAVPADMLRMVYYVFCNPDDPPALTLAQFAGFAQDCLTDPQLSGYVDEEMRAQLARLLPLTDEKTITTPLTAPMLAGATSMDETQILSLIHI